MLQRTRCFKNGVNAQGRSLEQHTFLRASLQVLVKHLYTAAANLVLEQPARTVNHQICPCQGQPPSERQQGFTRDVDTDVSIHSALPSQRPCPWPYRPNTLFLK